jgi:hypothetical protein
MWGAFSDEDDGSIVYIAAGPRQRSHSRVRVPWDSQPYFTVSDSRLLFSSPSMTLRATVKVFDPASTRHNQQLNYQSSLYNPAKDRTEIDSYIIACSLVAGETMCP